MISEINAATSVKAVSVRHAKWVWSYVAIGVFGLIIAIAVNVKSNRDYDAALERYKHDSQFEAEQAAKSMSYSLKQIYQGIRTISFLPSVKTIDRHGKNLDTNARESISQIYNNMASNVAVSEIYIVPVDLEPELVDPVTGGLQEPILMYDGKIPDPTKSEEAKKPITTVEQAKMAEEVEIYEYQLLKEHMTYFKANYATIKTIDALNLPLISGSQVLTCDNDDFEKTHKDEDRAGAVLSVPFYGPDGNLKGAITAVIRNNTLQSMLPTSNAALVNEAYQYYVFAKDGGQEHVSIDWVKQNKPDPALFFSAVVPVETTDPRSKWSFWVGYPDAQFLKSGDAKAVSNFRLAGFGFAALLTVLGSVICAVLQRSARVVQQKIAQLEADVSARMAENERMVQAQEEHKAVAEKQKRSAMNQLADDFELSVKGVVTQVASSATQMQSGAQGVTHIASDTKKLSASIVSAAKEAAQTSARVAAAAEELTASIAEISSQTQMSRQVAGSAASKAGYAKDAIEVLAEKSSRVGEIIQLITGIAGQINLLALNATIESARAGEAGRGFSVVASEVKGLANQVASATDEITQQINAMQSATQASVDAVMDILGIIEQVSQGTSAVAVAIEEQSAVTSEIARNVALTSSGTQQISRDMVCVQEGAEQTGDTALQVLSSANNLNEQSATLKQKVDAFLNTIRTS